MNEKVTYILGAGFSAPLGLPVMNNFLIRSKDLYFANPQAFEHFTAVFNTIEELSVSKNYYKTNLFNIEEILSIIEMIAFLEGKKLKQVFSRYISDVILNYTPVLKAREGNFPRNWYNFIFGGDSIHEHYCYFISNLLGIEFGKEDFTDEYGERIVRYYCRRIPDRKYSYAVISLNYDLVLENVCAFINTHYDCSEFLSFNTKNDPENWDMPPLAKLHGSVDIDLIIPPTWAKGTNSKIAPVWKNAYKILKESNHVRFIGYSLPTDDSYVKYLLKSAIIKAKHLKSIDVICLDRDGAAKRRYDDFIEFGDYRFVNKDVADYIKQIHSENKKTIRKIERNTHSMRMNSLEKIHEDFMNNL